MVKAQLPSNWVELVGVTEAHDQYTKEEVKRQEVGTVIIRSVCKCGIR